MEKNIEILTGIKNVELCQIPHFINVISEILDNPNQFIYKLDELQNLEIDRNPLLRIQIDCHLHMNEDIQFYQKRLYIARTIEKIVFGDILLDSSYDEDDDEE